MKNLFALLATFACAVTGWGFAYITNSNTGLPIKWPPGFVDISIMLGSSPTLQDGTNYSTSAQAAAQLWNAQLGSLQFRSTITTGTPADHNHVNELAFAANVFGQSFDSTTLAVTTTWRSGNTRTEGDIVFNTAKTWNSYDGPLQSGVIDIQRVAMHELGHMLGLDHPDEAGQAVQAVMNSHVSAQDTLAADDITGAQNLYGPPGVPANDDFASAIAITVGTSGTVTVNGFNTNATKQPGEPNHAGNSGGHSVWWKWTAPGGGSVTVDTGKVDANGKVDTSANKSSYFDTTLAIYTGASVSSLTTIASNDDITSGVAQVSTVTFTATGGTTYYFAVDGFDADSGGITLNLKFTPTAGTLPTITTQPISVTTTAGTNVVFGVSATAATSTPTYQWFFNGGAISGATSSTLSLTSVQSANAGSYFVSVSTTAGSVNSDTVTLTVNPAVVVPPPATPPASSGGGGGGGAPSEWFLLALGAAGLARMFRRR